MLYANQTEDDILLRGQLDSLAAMSKNFTVHYTLSRYATLMIGFKPQVV